MRFVPHALCEGSFRTGFSCWGPLPAPPVLLCFQPPTPDLTRRSCPEVGCSLWAGIPTGQPQFCNHNPSWRSVAPCGPVSCGVVPPRSPTGSPRASHWSAPCAAPSAAQNFLKSQGRGAPTVLRVSRLHSRLALRVPRGGRGPAGPLEVTRAEGRGGPGSAWAYTQLPPAPTLYSSGPSPESGAMRGGIRTVSPHPCPSASRCPLWPQLLLIACPISPAQPPLEMSSVYRQLLCGDQVGPGKESPWKPGHPGPSCVCST